MGSDYKRLLFFFSGGLLARMAVGFWQTVRYSDKGTSINSSLEIGQMCIKQRIRFASSFQYRRVDQSSTYTIENHRRDTLELLH